MIAHMIYLGVGQLPQHLHLRKQGLCAATSGQKESGLPSDTEYDPTLSSVQTPSGSLPQLDVHLYFLSSGSPVCSGMDGKARSSSLKVPSVPWHLCHLAFAWSPSLSLCFLLESCCLVLSDTTFQDSMLRVEKISRVSTWQATLRLNFIPHCFLLQSLPFLVPSLFPNNQVTSLNSSFVQAFSSL